MTQMEPTDSASVGGTTKRKRKWDQPDESLLSVNISIPGILPLGNAGSLGGSGISAAASGTLLTNSLTTSYVNKPYTVQAPLMPLQAAAVVQKFTQPKIQDELIIAREIVINDAEPAVRYKLTKRQTQEEIQKCTGAVVITRGKYRPPNAMPDGEKPLYLHISAGAHLNDTAERIMAVDRAAAMVEEMLKQVSSKVYSTCVYMGFDADPSLNIPARIRGPSDQYINHIINETGASVSLQGYGSDNTETTRPEDGEQPLHLFLSSSNPKALDDARLLAENLLDTISRECGIARNLPGKVYSAVPPPQKLLIGSQSSGIEPKSNLSSTSSSLAVPLVANQSIAPPVSSVTPVGSSNSFSFAPETVKLSLQNGLQPSLTGSHISYSGYGGIYPQVTPLQQVALALKQSCQMNYAATAVESTVTKSRHASTSSPEREKRPPQKRKFQELPTTSKGSMVSHQASEVDLSRSMSAADKSLRDISLMPPSKELAHLPSSAMPPPLPSSPKNKLATSSSRCMMPPPPPPKFSCSEPTTLRVGDKGDHSSMLRHETVPDTLFKLTEYGEDDDDNSDEDTGWDSSKADNRSSTVAKPFWAV